MVASARAGQSNALDVADAIAGLAVGILLGLAARNWLGTELRFLVEQAPVAGGALGAVFARSIRTGDALTSVAVRMGLLAVVLEAFLTAGVLGMIGVVAFGWAAAGIAIPIAFVWGLLMRLLMSASLLRAGSRLDWSVPR